MDKSIMTTFAISDFHFSHANILRFKTKEDRLLREFDNVDQMDDFIVSSFNDIVKPPDKCYILGDVSMDQTGLKHLKRLNGHKRLVLGNHDQGQMRLYSGYFEAVYSSRILDRMIFTHIPIHPDSIGKSKGNIHGHVHVHTQGLIGPKYFNVTCEALQYKPISIEEIHKRVSIQTGEVW